MRTAFCVQYGTRPDWLDNIAIPGKRDLFELCWSERPVHGAIHLPKSSWTQGRNRLARAVFDAEATSGVHYDYLIMSDDDIRFDRMSHSVGLEQLERTIDCYRPAIAVPNYNWHFLSQKYLDSTAEVQGIYATDVILEAMHRDTWPAMLPYWEEFDSQSWWNACHIDNRVAGTTFAGAVVQVNTVFVNNAESRDYPRAGRCVAADNMLAEMALPETVWHRHETRESFLPQPLRLQSHYHRTRDELATLWDVNHRFWKGRGDASIHAKISQALAA